MYDDLSDIAANRARIANDPPVVVTVEQFKFYAWAIKGLVGTVVLLALWYARVEYKIGGYDKIIAERGAQIAANTEYRTSNNIVNLGMQNSLDSLRDRFTNLENRVNKNEPRTNEMWFLKEHGISNKEDFAQRHGYRAPEDPDLPTPTPSPTSTPK
ncbi:MAG: hypothetical protein ABI162_07065 [Luteolibacter sp.]